jgi:hypothetical protein
VCTNSRLEESRRFLFGEKRGSRWGKLCGGDSYEGNGI